MDELKLLVGELKQKWEECEANHVVVFRYKLNVTREKQLEGDFKFFVQVNVKISIASGCDVM